MYKQDKLGELKAARDGWQKKHAKEFSKERKKEFLSESGIPARRMYTPLDLTEKNFDFLKDVGFPGEPPYVSGITSTMYRGQIWGIPQYSGYPTPRESNQWWKAQIEAGAPFIYIAYDLPSQLGYDPGHPMAEGEVGRVGVSMVSQKDWEVAFDGINLAEVNTSQVYNAPAIVGIANHLCLAEKQGLKPEQIHGFCQNDILKEYVARGNYIFPPAQSMRLEVDTLSYCGQHLPNYQAMQVCTIHHSERGANPVHEAAYGLADAFAYIQAAVDRGIGVDIIAPTMQFLGSCEHTHFFEEIAKHRAMRRIYARVIKERFKAKKPESCRLIFFSGNGGTTLHREQYLLNIARNALAALVGALSGVQYMNVRGYDEVYGIPTKEALLTSIRTSQVVAYETGVADVIDPLAGSYYVEWLTSEMEERIWHELETIEKLGGVVRCIENGYFQREMARDAYEWQKAFEAGEEMRVGVNCFRSEEEQRPARVYRADPKVEKERIADITELKRRRDNGKVRKALDEVKAMAMLEPTAQNNLLLPVLEAVKVYATTGEICDALRDIWGTYTEPSIN